MNYRQLVIGLIVGLAFGSVATVVLAQSEENTRPEIVMREGLAPTREAPNGKAQMTLYAEGDNAFLGKLRLKPGASVPEHEDESEEYLYVVRGSGTLTINGQEYQVKPHTGVYLPSGATVSFQNDGQVFEAVQMFAPADSANKYKDWATGSSPMNADERGGSESER